jgi:quercetin 2,3-dioxygenase
MKYVIHKSETRGFFDHQWLQTHHTFSFADYFDPNRNNFGMLRVLNDDIIQAGAGFPLHPHKNMEIISIPISGALEHKDSMGNVTTIRDNEIQVMSAGSGIMHSEYNPSDTEDANFLQIWILPDQINIRPVYDQIKINETDLVNQFKLLVSPGKNDDTLWINQDAHIYLGKFEAGKSANLKLNSKKNGLYLFVIEGSIRINDQFLEHRDGIGIYDTDSIDISILTGSKLLALEVPME